MIPPVSANVVRIGLDRIVHDQIDAENLMLDFLPATEGRPAALLRLHAQRLKLSPLGQTLREVRFECPPAPLPVVQPGGAIPAGAGEAGDSVPAATVWRCEGALSWRGGKGWRLAIQVDEALTAATLRLGQGSSEVVLDLPLAGKPLSVAARRVGTSWLKALLPQVTWQSGQIDADAELRATDGGSADWHGTVRTRALSAQAAAGAVELAGLELAGPVIVRSGAKGALTIEAEPAIRAGEMLAGQYYLGWPTGSQVDLKLVVSGSGSDWRFDQFDLRDTGMALSANGRIGPAGLRELSGRYRFDLEQSYGRYLDGAMAAIGQGGLVATGRVEGTVELADGGRLETVDAALSAVDLRHPDGRYGFTGLEGTLAIRRGQTTAPFNLAWQRLAVYSLAAGPGTLQGQARNGELSASRPVQLDLLGGRLLASDLVIRPLSESGSRVQTSLQLDGIDMAGLALAFGWPEFAGEVSGRLPRLSYDGNVLDVDGEIGIQMFDGTVAMGGLTIERPFGVAPALSADVRLDGLDLQPMTDVFGFGRIEGRLNGSILGLRLLDWRPVAFNAELATANRGRRRISQLAVEQLTQIGGGGGAAGLQGRLLGVFDSFGYKRIGLSCVLANGVCTMGGVDESAGGYTILQGSGLPLITIRGFQERVDWPVLIDRLQAAVSGEGPTVE